MSKKAAIVADNYKIETFRRNLKEAGFEWTECFFSDTTTILEVVYEQKNLYVLSKIVETSNAQAKQKK